VNDDELTIRIGGQTLSGWQEVRVTRSIERVVSDFEIALTEKFPRVQDVVIAAGQPCEVFLGYDKVITGYVDRYIPEITAQTHTVRIAGRSKTQDMVDCAAEWPGSQIINGDVLKIAQTLLKEPFGIDAYSLVDVGPVVPKTVLNQGDSPFDVLEPIARLRGLLMYDDANGNLLFSRVGEVRAASGFKEGENVEAAGIAWSMDQRFSSYKAYRVKVPAFADKGNESNLITDQKDPGVPRYRPKIFVAETNDGGFDVAKRRAIWEMNRRIGRSAAVHLVTDGWRDSAGALWTPNTLVPVELPTLKLPHEEWLIGEVTYIRSAAGTHAQLVIMHPGAFMPEPLVWPFPNDLATAIDEAVKARDQEKAQR
jgi:prophage tail gpP-like protein